MSLTGKIINDIKISYNDFGKGDKTIIFIHGFPFDKSSWDMQLQALRDDFRVISYDIRGFGQTTPGSAPFSIDLFADDLIGLIDYLQIPRAVVCGLSMGGYIALNAVSRFPDKFQGLVLCDTQCNDDSPEAKEKRYQTIDLLKNGGLSQWAEVFTRNLFAESSFQKIEVQVNRIKSTVLSASLDSLIYTLKALAERKETCSMLASVQIPTLIICGEEDKITPPGKSVQMHQDIKSSVLRIIPNAAHLSNIEQPEIFNRHLKDFLLS